MQFTLAADAQAVSALTSSSKLNNQRTIGSAMAGMAINNASELTANQYVLRKAAMFKAFTNLLLKADARTVTQETTTLLCLEKSIYGYTRVFDGPKLISKLVDLYYGVFKGDKDLLPLALLDADGDGWRVRGDWRERFPDMATLEACEKKLPPPALKMIFDTPRPAGDVHAPNSGTSSSAASGRQHDQAATTAVVTEAVSAMYATMRVLGNPFERNLHPQMYPVYDKDAVPSVVSSHSTSSERLIGTTKRALESSSASAGDESAKRLRQDTVVNCEETFAYRRTLENPSVHMFCLSDASDNFRVSVQKGEEWQLQTSIRLPKFNMTVPAGSFIAVQRMSKDSFGKVVGIYQPLIGESVSVKVDVSLFVVEEEFSLSPEEAVKIPAFSGSPDTAVEEEIV